MAKDAYEYVLVRAENIGGSQTKRRCRDAMDTAMERVGNDAVDVATYLEQRALDYHKQVDAVPTTQWTTDEWERLGYSNACSFAATYIRAWFGDYMTCKTITNNA